MEHNEQIAQKQRVKRGPVHEGPKNHFITFGISIFLTMIAFIAAANESLSPKFVTFLLVTMALVQALFQLFFWMHMKDKGHFYPVLFLGAGFLVAMYAFASALFWIWW